MLVTLLFLQCGSEGEQSPRVGDMTAEKRLRSLLKRTKEALCEEQLKTATTEAKLRTSQKRATTLESKLVAAQQEMSKLRDELANRDAEIARLKAEPELDAVKKETNLTLQLNPVPKSPIAKVSPRGLAGKVIRIASWNLQCFDMKKTNNDGVLEVVCSVILQKG